jgi:hypothetical protein
LEMRLLNGNVQADDLLSI